MAKEKFLLAYSGGLDTSIIIPWLLEHYDCEVVAYCGEVGVGVDHDYLEKKALKCGAIKCIIEDITDEFVSDFVYPTLKANAVYEGKYLLGTSMARPVIAKHFVEAAHANGCTTIVHGCTGKGNDQVRFELSIKALDPDMKILAPWRIWDIKSRDEEIGTFGTSLTKVWTLRILLMSLTSTRSLSSWFPLKRHPILLHM